MRGNHASRMSSFLFLCIHLISVAVRYAEMTTAQAETCNFYWNITKVDKQTLTVAWSGDGYGNLTVVLKERCSESNCSQSRDTANFSEKRLELKPWSNNTKYDVEITFNCPYSSEKRIKTIWTPPAPPSKIESSDCTDTNITLHWKRQPGTGKIEMYRVKINDSLLFMETPNTTAEIAGLQAYTVYDVQVAAKNQDFWGEMSEKFQVRTESGVPGVPLNIRDILPNTSIHLQWEEPKPFVGPIVNYTVWWDPCPKTDDFCRTHTKLHSVARCLPKSANTTGKNFYIFDLDPYKEYKVKVRAYTSAGAGEWSEEKIYRRLNEVSHMPKNLRCTNITSESLTLRWDEPIPHNEDIEEYIAKLYVQESLTHFLCETDRTRTIFWKGLSPFTSYYVSVAAVIPGGLGPSATLNVKTLPGAPGPPELTVKRTQDTSITVSWNHSIMFRARRTDYTLRWGVIGGTFEILKFIFDEKEYTITDLTPFTMYQVQIQSNRLRINGPWSEAEWIQTKMGVRKPAIIIREIHLLEGRSAQVNWTMSGDYPGPFNYTLKAWNVPGPFYYCFNKYQPISIMGTISKEDWIGNHSDVVTNLRPFQEYVFEILVFTLTTNETGWSDISEPIITEREVPEEPTNVTASCSFNSTQAIISWNPPKNYTGSIWFYVVEYADQNGRFSEEISVANMCEEQSLLLSGLTPERSYDIGVFARVRGFYVDGKMARIKVQCFLPTGGVSNMAIPLGSVVSVIILGVLVAGVCRMRRKSNLDKCEETIQQSSGCSNKSFAVSEQEMEEYSLSRSIKCKNLDNYIRIMMPDHHLKFSQEFEMLENKSPHFPCTIAEREINRSKNRWKDLLPFDHSRVKLLAQSDVPGSDFINANYIPGISSCREYIGCQGPLSNTVDDFWRMIWEQSVSMVVMLTQCVERDMQAYKKKCEQYWPDSGQSNHYGDLRVTCAVESILPSYVIREFHVEMDPYERQVKQMHFTHWPDFGSPECPEVLLNFVKDVRANLPKEEAGPILVHCSAGVGRTGTYIVVDRLSQQLQVASASPEDDTVNIYATVLELRKHRTNLVQTEDQYIYAYQCVNQLIRERDESLLEVYEDLV